MKQNADNKEQEILETAEKLFLKKGFDKTSTVEIAREVGVNQALVHYYYRTKEGLLQAVMQKKVRTIVRMLEVMTDDDLPFRESLEKGIRAHFRFVRNNPRLPSFMTEVLDGHPERAAIVREVIAPMFDDNAKSISRRLKEEVAAGRVRPMVVQDLMTVIFSLNVAPFFATPMVKGIMAPTKASFEAFLDHRCEENVRIVMASLAPNPDEPLAANH